MGGSGGDERVELEASGDHVVCLEGSVDVSRAAEWLSEAKRAAAKAGGVTVQCEGLERLDASGLQILLALKRAVEDRGRGFRVVGLRPHVAALLQRVGAGALLSIDADDATRGAS
jgi:anti-anti-sigma factor